MTTTEKQFIALLQFALHPSDSIPLVLNTEDIDWDAIFRIAQEQAVSGVAFAGVMNWRRSDIGQRNIRQFSPRLFTPWYGLACMLRQENERLTELCRKICGIFGQAGFRACILKGQGNAALYRTGTDIDTDLIRTSGDIDVWVMPEGVSSIAESRKLVTGYIRSICPGASQALQHIDFPVVRDVVIEVHYVPVMDNNPIMDRRLKRFFEEHASDCFGNVERGGFAVPTKSVNGLFQLHHIKRHFINEGIGMRHVIDYYFLLRSMTDAERGETWRLAREFGCDRFASALMGVISMLNASASDADSGFLLCLPNEETGRHLLEEIMRGGNFGRYDERRRDINDISFFARWRKNVALSLTRFRYFPVDVFWSYVFRLRVSLWRRTGISIWMN